MKFPDYAKMVKVTFLGQSSRNPIASTASYYVDYGIPGAVD